jgi:integrase
MRHQDAAEAIYPLARLLSSPVTLHARGVRLTFIHSSVGDLAWLLSNVGRPTVGLPWLHFHDLRHFSGTVAAQAGATTRDLMTRMGDSSPDMVVRYMHAEAERDAHIASEMDRLAAKPERSRRFASKSKNKDKSLDKSPGPRRAGGDRTHDPRIMSPLL